MKQSKSTLALAVVELDKELRVKCQIPGCGQSIWKAVHVVEIDNELKVIGANCFKQIFHQYAPGVGHYTGSESQKLTEDERNTLIQNTEKLIALLKQGYEALKPEPLTPVPPVSEHADTLPSVCSSDYIPDEEVPTRTVTCYYCNYSMKTHRLSPPALGYKCNVCIENKVPIPPRNKYRSRRPKTPIEPEEKVKAREAYLRAKGE